MAGPFDPYHRWLGIPPQDQPPNHYRLLGLQLFEDDADVIENAADQRMAHLRTFQTGKHSSLSQKLLNEVATAKVYLLNPQKRAAYDELLRQKLAEKAAEAEAERPPQAAEPVDPQLAGLFAEIDQALPAVRARVAAKKRSLKPAIVVASVAAAGLVILGLILKGVLSTAETALVLNWPEDERKGATLKIDGGWLVVEPSGPLRHHCARGWHEIEATRAGFEPFRKTVWVEEGQTQTVRPLWQKSPDRDPKLPPGREIPARVEWECASYQWENGSPGVKMIPGRAGFCFISALSGRFAGGGEWVDTGIGDQQAWWLLGNSLQTELAGEAVSVSVPAPLKVELNDHSWSRDQPPTQSPTKMIRKDEGFCVFTGISGEFPTPGDGIDIRIDMDGFWCLGGSAPFASLRATSVRFLPPESVKMDLREYTWARGDPPVKMLHKKDGFALFAGFRGAMRGYQQRAGVSLGKDGYWYLDGRSDQALTARAISVRITRRTVGRRPPDTTPSPEPPTTGGTTGSDAKMPTAPGNPDAAPEGQPPKTTPAEAAARGRAVPSPKEFAWVLDLGRKISHVAVAVSEPPADAKVYLGLSGVASWPVPGKFREGKSQARVNERIGIELRDLPGAQISVTLVRHTDGFRLKIQSTCSGPDGEFPFTPSDVGRRADTIPKELQKSEAELQSLPGQIRQNESLRAGLLAQLQRAQAGRDARMSMALKAQIGNLTHRIDIDNGSLKRLPKQIENQRSLCKILPDLRRAIDSLHGKAQLQCRVFVKRGEEELDLIDGKGGP